MMGSSSHPVVAALAVAGAATAAFQRKITIPSSASRLVIVTGASRGVGVGICRKVLQTDPNAHVLVTARQYEHAKNVCQSLNTDNHDDDDDSKTATIRAHPFSLDVTDDASCQSLVQAIKDSSMVDTTTTTTNTTIPLVLVCNAGIALDLPWFPTPWRPEVALQTMEVNLYGTQRITEACLPLLQQSLDGRVIFVSSGGGRANMKRMSDKWRNELLLRDDLTWNDIYNLSIQFIKEYQEAAQVGCQDTNNKQLPHLSPSGFWLQSYGFSKAAMGSYCQILHRLYSSNNNKFLSVACSPGFIATDMSRTYAKYDELKTIDEGGEIIAWLATTDRTTIKGGTFYTPDQESVSWVAD